MDNPATEPNAPLDTASAADLFTQLLDGQPAEPPADPEVKAEATPEPETVEVEQTEEAEPTITIKIDGKDVEVPLSEVKNGYQRQADYTRKTMEAAEVKKTADAELTKAREERQQYGQKLEQAQTLLQAMLASQAQETNWDDLLANNPTEYLKQKHLLEQRQAALQRVHQEKAQLAQRFQAEQAEAFAHHLSQQRDQLLAKLPEWKDEAKANLERLAIRKYLIEQGFDERALENVADHRAVVMARKAMLYDQAIAKASAATKKVQTLPTKAERPGVGTDPLDRRSAQFQKLSRTGKVEDAAAVFASLL